MRRFRVNVLLIAAGLLLLNLGNFAFANAAGLAATLPVAGEDTDAASLSVAADIPSARREAVPVARRQKPAQPAALVTRPAFPSLVTRHASLSWHLAERAAAAPRAPASLA